MPKPDPDYLSPYVEAARSFGARFEALLWRDVEAQRARFDAFIDMASPTSKAVADLGCGLADLLARMNERNVGQARYIGVEAVPSLAAEARDRLDRMGHAGGSSRRAEIIEADFASDESIGRTLISTERADVLYFSGSLNTFQHKAAAKILERAWEAVAQKPGASLVFNFLSDRCDAERRKLPTGPAHRFNTLKLLDWAMEQTPVVQFRQDYLAGHDATIAMTAV